MSEAPLFAATTFTEIYERALVGPLFRPFARGVTADGPAGLGLGLALSRSLAQAMGGELAYRAGAGATFVLTLPRA